MSWQDLVFGTGQIIFVLALIPTIIGKSKPEFSTSLLNSIILLLFAYTYSTLNLWTSVITSIILFLAWSTLAVQKYLIDKKKNESR